MEWTQFIIFFLGVFGLFIWNRAEGRADARHMDQKIDVMRELVHGIHKETTQQIAGMREEMKDFHARLTAIEERRGK
jgi:hypothetical protein